MGFYIREARTAGGPRRICSAFSSTLPKNLEKTSKEKTPSRGSDDLRPEKKRKPNPPPRSGKRPIYCFQLCVNDVLVNARTLLDTGSDTPMLSKSFALLHSIPQVIRDEPMPFRDYAGKIVPGSGEAYSYLLELSYQDHFTMESFEILEMDDSCDVILPAWWMAKHPCIGHLYGKLKLTSKRCRNCTREKAHQIEITLDERILDEEYWDEVKEVARLSSAATTTAGKGDRSVTVDNILPSCYQQYKRVFEEKIASQLPPHRRWDHAIDLKPGETAPWGPIYPLSQDQLQALREYLDTMLREGKIRPSKSPAGAPILFVPKPHGGGLRLCVDYRGLNRVTIMNRFPLPLMSELQDRICGAKIFTKLDLKNGYNLIRIKQGDE